MTVYRDIPLSKWFVAALLAAVAQVAIAPSAVQAECGDYVILGGHGAFSKGAHSNWAHRDLAPADSHHRSPCSGPNCSNDGSRPLDEPSAPPETNVRQSGLMPARCIETANVIRFVQVAADPSLSGAAANPVFRPPR
jgi:hypothetical protein